MVLVRAFAVIGAILAVAGCALVADAPPSAVPDATVPEQIALVPEVAESLRAKVEGLARDSARRAARTLTLRVRNGSCVGVGTGSGFAIDRNILITNRHVLAGANFLEVNTWDGRTLNVSAAGVGVLGDLGVAQVDGALPTVGGFATRPARHGDTISTVGYPLGGPLTIARGVVVDRVHGEPYAIPGDVIRLTSRVEPGNSGGPVLNRNGRVVAIVFAIEIETGYALAIPVDTMLSLAQAGGLEDVPPCGSE